MHNFDALTLGKLRADNRKTSTDISSRYEFSLFNGKVSIYSKQEQSNFVLTATKKYRATLTSIPEFLDMSSQVYGKDRQQCEGGWVVCLQPCISGHRRCGWPPWISSLGFSPTVWAPTAPEPLASMHFYAPSLWVASLATAAIELAQCRMQQRYTFCNHTRERMHANYQLAGLSGDSGYPECRS